MLLRVNNLSVSYGAIQALRGVSLEVDRGEIVTLIGSNGAGKTTLLRTISGLIRPTGGTIDWQDGTPLVGTRPDRIVAMGVSHVPEGRQIFANMTVRENLMLGAYQRSASAEIAKDLEQCYSLFPVLAERKDQRSGTLSGGEQQMLAIAKALASGPQLLVLDEPSQGLAPSIVAEVGHVLRTLKDENFSVLIAEQNLDLVTGLADRYAVLAAGRIVDTGPIDRLDRDDVARHFLTGEIS
jgi:branched-chain amino acid transport system ATP-binding protein